MKGAVLNKAVAAVLLALTVCANATGQEGGGKSTPQLLALLEKSGYSYTKVQDGVYEVPATGKNLKEFSLRVVETETLLLVIAKLADRSDVSITEGFAVKLLELNDNYDVVKFALSDEMLYARIDAPSRLMDAEELKNMVEIMARVIDECYPEVAPFLGPDR